MLFNSLLLALLPGLAIAANDWSKPCTSGTCSYESGDGTNTAWSNLVINAASTDVLSDITSASGWEILNCDSKSTDPQDIRLVCVDQAKGCSHLFNGGAEDTIIRLPENCAGGPFARVVRTWVDKDQTLPARLAKRGQTNGQVRGLALDFDFSKIPESRGKVYITAAGTNSPAQRDVIRSAVMKRSLQPIRHANRRGQAAAVVRDFTSAPVKRAPGFFGDAFKKAKSTVQKGVDVVKSAPKKIKQAVKAAPKKIKAAAKKVVDTAKKVPKKIKQAAKAVPKKIKAAAKKVVDTAKKVPKKIKQAVKAVPKKIKAAAKKVVDTAKKVPKKIKEVAKAVPKKIKAAAKKVVDTAKKVPKKIKEAAKKVVDKGKEVANNLKSKVKEGAAKVVDKAKSLGKSIVKGGEKALDKADDLVDGAEKKVGEIIDSGTGAVEDFVDSVGNSTDFDKTFNKDFNLIDINKNFPILDQSVSCPQQGKTPAFDAGLKMDVDVAAKMTANVGFIVTGSIVPPNIDKLAFTGGLSGDVSATFNLNANAKGTFETPDVKLFEVGLPGLSFPGILAVGPSFSINAKANAELGIVADISVGASIALPDMQFTFPPSEGDSSANVNPKDAPIKLNVGASATLTGRAEAHIIPRLDIGVTLLNGAAKATVFANVDAFAGLDFTLDAKIEGTPVDGTVGNPDVDLKNFESSIGGSVGMDLGVSINVGAEAALEPFFNTGANFEVFQKTFPLFEKKFGDQARKRSVLTLDDGRLSKRALVCPAAGEGTPNNSVVDAVTTGAA